MQILNPTTTNMAKAHMIKTSTLVGMTTTLATINTTKIKDTTKRTMLTTTEMISKHMMNMPITTTMDTIKTIKAMTMRLTSNSSSITTTRTLPHPNMTSSSMTSIQKQNQNTTSLIQTNLIPRNKKWRRSPTTITRSKRS